MHVFGNPRTVLDSTTERQAYAKTIVSICQVPAHGVVVNCTWSSKLER
jgi:hypothetical protein